MNAKDVNKVRLHLTKEIRRSLISSAVFAANKCLNLGSVAQEPDFIASLIIKFTPDLFNILKTNFPKNRFSVTGVFCHQKPLVDIGESKCPEIGDLLFVYIQTDDKGNKRLNSILFQAKISNAKNITVSKNDQHQLQLYSKWPSFTYKRAGSLNGGKRDILPKTINDGAQYLLIYNNPIGKGTPMGCAIPSKILSHSNSLEKEIVEFIKFKAGRAFEEDPTATNDDWTKMIWDLLAITKNKVSKRKNAGIPEFPRQISRDFDGYCYFMTENSSIYGDLHKSINNGDFNNSKNQSFDDDNYSPSVILIESSIQSEE